MAKRKTDASVTVTEVPLSAFVLDPENARQHPERNARTVEQSVRDVGFARSIVVVPDGEDEAQNRVLAGNLSLQSAHAAGLTKGVIIDVDGQTVVAVRRRGLTEVQQKQLALADNRAGELATWNQEELQRQLRALQDAGSDLAALGWTREEQDALIGAIKPIVAGPADIIDEGPWASHSGDIYALGPHRLACGDSTDPALSSELFAETEGPRLWIHDPPYDVPFGQWPLMPSVDVVAVWHRGKDAYRWMGETFAGDEWGVHGLVFTGGVRGQHNSTLPCCMHDNVSVWRRKWWDDETDAIDGSVIVACGCRATTDRRPVSWQEHVGGVLTGAGGMSWGKPVLENAIVMAYVPRGAVVWDPCAGSGSSLIAAAMHGRIWRGVEQQPKWCDLIRRRWHQHATTFRLPPDDGLP